MSAVVHSRRAAPSVIHRSLQGWAFRPQVQKVLVSGAPTRSVVVCLARRPPPWLPQPVHPAVAHLRRTP